jgi:hypothetical protein
MTGAAIGSTNTKSSVKAGHKKAIGVANSVFFNLSRFALIFKLWIDR